jgi:D-alanyl-D-alanine carboxypeptidase (penicillin-binding protein 5/6)
MANLADHVIRTYPDLYKYFGEKEFTWNKIRQANRNPLLFMELGADGLKTGFIEDSGYGLVGSAVQNGQRLIVVVSGCKTAKERAEEARKILQWGFRAFEPKTIFVAGEPVGSAKVYGGERGDVPLLASGPVKILLPRGSGEKLSGRIVYDGPLIAPVAEGVQVGRLKIMRGQVLALDLPLTTGDSVAVGSLPRRALDASLEYATLMFRKYVSKKDK